MAKEYLFPELSVFFPCYNEAENIAQTVTKALPTIRKIARLWEIIIVNDGSSDTTLQVAKEIAKKYGKNIRIVNHSHNRGYGAAFKSGFYKARYHWITFNDADGQFAFADIRALAASQKKTGADLVIGFYLDRKVPLARKLGSFAWQLAVYVLFSLRVRDIDCGFKLVKKEVINKIPSLEAERGPFISSEFLIKAKQQGFKITEVGVHHFPRQAGVATGAQLKVVIAGFTDLLKLWKKSNFS